jgi:hypothetical protein
MKITKYGAKLPPFLPNTNHDPRFDDDRVRGVPNSAEQPRRATIVPPRV